MQDRDKAWNDDFVGIVLDTYNDERRAFEFFANPLGVQMDLTNDDVNQREDDSWNAIWDSAGQITDARLHRGNGNSALNQLRFPHIDGKQTWGFDLLRFLSTRQALPVFEQFPGPRPQLLPVSVQQD